MFFARHGDSRDEGDMPAKLYIYSLYAPTSMVRGSWRMPTTAPRTNLDNLYARVQGRGRIRLNDPRTSIANLNRRGSKR